MKKIKSYTGIWNVEKVLYAINDFTLPFPVTFTQITWFVITEFAVILLGDLPPLSLIEGAAYRGGVFKILRYSRCPHMVYEPKDL